MFAEVKIMRKEEAAVKIKRANIAKAQAAENNEEIITKKLFPPLE